MARYYGEVQGNRGAVSRTGHKTSGIWSHVRGWNVGARTVVDVSPDDPEQDRDYVEVAVTAGSNGGSMDRIVATVDDTPDGRKVTLYDEWGAPIHTYIL